MLVTSVYPGPRGGAVSFGKDPSGNPLRALVDGAHICRPPRRGESWRLQGVFRRHPQFGDQFHVENARPLKPDGRVVTHYLTHHPAFRGIGVGPAKVARLSKTFGDGLVSLLDRADVEKLSVVLGEACAGNLVERSRENAQEARVAAFLDACSADVRLASRVLRYWPDRTVEKLRENPYRLLFLVGWPTADRIARSLGIGLDDDRRLIAAAESVIYTRLHVEKDTRMDTADLQDGILQLTRLREVQIAQRAIELATTEGTLVGDERTSYQAFGCAVMEKFLATKFQRLLSLRAPEQDRDGGITAVHDAIGSFEQANGIHLNTEQRSAVEMAMSHRLSVLKGGAGVGKTTLLKAIGAVAEARKGHIIQMALAGRAA